MNSDSSPQRRSPGSWLKLIATAAAAAFGVQSENQRRQDFAEKSIIPYILAGIVFTALFLAGLIGIVSVVI